MPKEIKTDKLGSLPGSKPSNTNPVAGTASEPNPVKRSVKLGRNPEIKTAAADNIESLRPGGKNG